MYSSLAPGSLSSKRRLSVSRLPTLAPLPASSSSPRSPSSPSSSRRHLLLGALRTRFLQLVTSPVGAFAGIIFVVFSLAWMLGMLSGGSGGSRARTMIGKRSVTARDWEDGRTGMGGDDGARGAKDGEVVLILCPMKNSIEHIWHFFHLLDTLSYPRHLMQIGILVSDSSDRTYARALELADERQIYRGRGSRYASISVFRKDFESERDGVVEEERRVRDQHVKGMLERGELARGEMVPGEDNIGGRRHDYDLQVSRRGRLAKSRTWLISAAMTPEVDWVLWIDVDVVDYERDLIQVLRRWAGRESAHVVVPNCMWKTYNEMGSYDRNNWIETPASLEMKSKLPSSEVLIEGYPTHPTFRQNMADMYPPTSTTPDSITLDGVGGCTALVKASVHREGAVFPSWVVDHQLETEGFAQMVKAIGGRLVGLPKYYVFHGLYG